MWVAPSSSQGARLVEVDGLGGVWQGTYKDKSSAGCSGRFIIMGMGVNSYTVATCELLAIYYSISNRYYVFLVSHLSFVFAS